MLYSVITTNQKPTASVLGLVEKLNEVGGKLIVAGVEGAGGLQGYEWRSSFALRGSGVTVVTGGESKDQRRESRAAEEIVAGGW
jgi:hypothetical protein